MDVIDETAVIRVGVPGAPKRISPMLMAASVLGTGVVGLVILRGKF